MVSFTSSLVFVAAAFGVAYGYTEAEAEAALAKAAALPEGEYYRPPTYLTSGSVNSTAPFRRSPCPAMNSLANHGYLPRDGKNITVDQAVAVVMDKFNIAEDLAAVMGGLSPDLFDLNGLSKHNDQVEHDASLARIDSYFGVDPYLITSGLINDVLNYGLDGSVDVTDVATIRAARVAWGQENNPEFDFSTTPAFIAGAESALFLRGFGGDNGNSTATTFIATFFLQEMFPEGWTKPDTSITYDDALATISYLNAVSVAEDRNAGLDIVGVLKRHSVIPFSKLCTIAACLSVFYLLADYFWYAALVNVSVTAGTAIFNCSPLFVYCFSICFLHERLTLGKMCGIMTSLVGVTLVVMFQNGSNLDALAGTSLVAGLLVVISAALYGGYEVALRLAVGEDITDTSTLLTMTGLCGLFTVPLWIVGSFVLAYSPFVTMHEPLGFPVTGSGVFLLLLSGAMAVVFNVFLPLSLCWTSPLETSVGVMLTIPLSGVLDTLIHQTSFSWECIVGSGLVMGGFGILEYSNDQTAALEKQHLDQRAPESSAVLV
ncbi:hypothetical protein BBP00_00002749 [Phytophthora kernoviae]|uniref:Heme haloperoxidase family profile domain-containing protein n=1 Tax=Phytophthora kernoviae TaxID=325452 RepID=A0A3F2RWK7_9STRA|nr:hypothetical protein BBP00_00002749 [Phytophthora kernoviae]